MLFFLTQIRYSLAVLAFRICHRDHTGRYYLFPRDLRFEIAHLPSGEDFQKATGPVFLQGELAFRHGLLGRSATVRVFRRASVMQRTFWCWHGSGSLTPGWLLEDLESSWLAKRTAMEATMALQEH